MVAMDKVVVRPLDAGRQPRPSGEAEPDGGLIAMEIGPDDAPEKPRLEQHMQRRAAEMAGGGVRSGAKPGSMLTATGVTSAPIAR